MGVKTTMAELATHWQGMTAEERLNYRVRFGDDVLEVISIEVAPETAAEPPSALVRGYQLNGAMADHQRDDNSRVARVRNFPLNLGGVEILDLDEPVEEDDPGPPPPVLRLSPTGELERVDEDPEPPPVEHVETPPEPPTWQQEAWQHAEAMEGASDPLLEAMREHLRHPIEEHPAPGVTIVRDLPPGTHTIQGVTVVVPPPRESVLDTPVSEWASTAIRMPHPLLERAAKAARDRMIGRNKLLAYLVEQGLNRLEDEEPLGN